MSETKRTTIRIAGRIGRRAHAVALLRAETIRYLGTQQNVTVMTFAKRRHARDVERLQAKDARDALR